MLRHRVTEPRRDTDADPRAALCRNCGAPAPGAYCPACGQETRLALPMARQFLREAAGRYVPLDGRLWRTLFGLVFRPGCLTREYFAGRRRRYVRPARLFLVLSLALFALLPLFALLLQIAYAGRRRRHPLRPRKYAEHLVFGAHNHAFLCVALMLAAMPVGPLRFALAVWAVVYFLRSMKVVYGGSWPGIVVRAGGIAIAYLSSFAFVVVGLLVAAMLLA